MEEIRAITSPKRKSTQNIQRDFVIDSLFSVLKAKSEKSEKRTEELLSVIRKIETNNKINWATILIKIMERMKTKDQEIKDLKEKNTKLREENQDLKIEIERMREEAQEVNDSVMSLVDINLGILDEVHVFKSKILEKEKEKQK